MLSLRDGETSIAQWQRGKIMLWVGRLSFFTLGCYLGSFSTCRPPLHNDIRYPLVGPQMTVHPLALMECSSVSNLEHCEPRLPLYASISAPTVQQGRSDVEMTSGGLKRDEADLLKIVYVKVLLDEGAVPHARFDYCGKTSKSVKFGLRQSSYVRPDLCAMPFLPLLEGSLSLLAK